MKLERFDTVYRTSFRRCEMRVDAGARILSRNDGSTVIAFWADPQGYLLVDRFKVPLSTHRDALMEVARLRQVVEKLAEEVRFWKQVVLAPTQQENMLEGPRDSHT